MLIYRAICLPEWTDYNGHMNDALYGRVFSDAIDGLMDAVGLDQTYRQKTKGTVYTLEDHRWYEWEVHEGADLRVETHVLDFDLKRIHLWQGLYVGDQRCAVCETMLMHISQAEAPPRSAPLPASVQAALDIHKRGSDATDQTLSPRAGVIGIRRKS